MDVNKKTDYKVGNIIGSPVNDELRESYRIEKKQKRNSLIGKAVLWGGLTLGALGMMYHIYRNSPQAYISNYSGEWVPVVAKYDDRIWKMANERGAGEYILSWVNKIEEKNTEKNPGFDSHSIQIGDTIWLPKDFKIKNK